MAASIDPLDTVMERKASISPGPGTESVHKKVTEDFHELLEESKRMLFDLKMVTDDRASLRWELQNEAQGVELAEVVELDEDSKINDGAALRSAPKINAQDDMQLEDFSNDEECQGFQKRKQTIVDNVTKMAQIKYPPTKGAEKKNEMLSNLVHALDEEE